LLQESANPSTPHAFRVPSNEIFALRKFAEAQISGGFHASASLIFQSLYTLTKSEEDLLCAAIQARLARNFAAAREIFQAILDRFGNKYSTCMEAGLCELAIGNNSEAEKLFKRAYSLKETAHAALWRGVALKRLNNFPEAIEALSSALRIDRSIASIYIELGQCLEAVSNCEAATRLYLELPTNAPSETKTFVLNRLGQCYSKLGNRQALSALLDSKAYTEYMNTPYAIASNVLWSLQLNRRIDDEHLIRQAQTLTDHHPKQPMFDALTLNIAKQVRIDTDVLERYRQSFFSDPYGKDAFSVVSDFNLDNLTAKLIQLKFLRTRQLAHLITERITTRTPFSMLRLGDGEGNFIMGCKTPENSFLVAQENKILHHWFGTPLELSEYGELCRELETAVCEADVIGVPDAQRLQTEMLGEPRGYWGTYFAAEYACNLPGRRLFCDASAHVHLFQEKDFAAGLKRARELHTISCHRRLGEILRSELNVETGTDMIVPGEKSNEKLPLDCKTGIHYPDRYREILHEIGTLGRGSVVTGPRLVVRIGC